MKNTLLAFALLFSAITALATPTPDQMKSLCERDMDPADPSLYIYAPQSLLNDAKIIHITVSRQTGQTALDMNAQTPDSNIRYVAGAALQFEGKPYYSVQLSRRMVWQPKGVTQPQFPFTIQTPTLTMMKQGLCLSDETFGSPKSIPLEFHMNGTLEDMGLAELTAVVVQYQMGGRSFSYTSQFSKLDRVAESFIGDILVQNANDLLVSIRFRYLNAQHEMSITKTFQFLRKAGTDRMVIEVNKDSFSP